jgi:hypothetical protein
VSRLRFRIEQVLADRGIVFARPLDTGELRLTPMSTLGVRPVRHFDVPRKLREDGTLDMEVIGFFLRNPSDVVHFPVGAVVVYADE